MVIVCWGRNMRKIIRWNCYSIIIRRLWIVVTNFWYFGIHLILSHRERKRRNMSRMTCPLVWFEWVRKHLENQIKYWREEKKTLQIKRKYILYVEIGVLPQSRRKTRSKEEWFSSMGHLFSPLREETAKKLEACHKRNFSFITFQKWVNNLPGITLDFTLKRILLAFDWLSFCFCSVYVSSTFQRIFLIAQRILTVFVWLGYLFSFPFLFTNYFGEEKHKKIHCNSSEKQWIIDEFNNRV